MPFAGPPKYAEVARELNQLRDYLDNTLAPHTAALEMVVVRVHELLNDLVGGAEAAQLDARTKALLKALADANRPLVRRVSTTPAVYTTASSIS